MESSSSSRYAASTAPLMVHEFQASRPNIWAFYYFCPLSGVPIRSECVLRAITITITAAILRPLLAASILVIAAGPAAYRHHWNVGECVTFWPITTYNYQSSHLTDNLESFFSSVLLHSFEPCLQRLAPEGLVPL